MELLEKVKENFNNPDRVRHDLESYDLVQATHSADPFEKHRENLLVDEILKLAPQKVLDIGCGIGHLCKRLLMKGINCQGIDISESMVQQAKKLLSDNLFSSDLISVEDIFTYKNDEEFDLIIANGVIWYYENKGPFLLKINKLLKPNGHALIVHRNLLFNIFALNQGTLDLFFNHFFCDLSKESKQEISNVIKQCLPGLASPIKKEGALDKPYDNPFTIHQLYETYGFNLKEILYTYIHPAPPRVNIALDPNDFEALQKNYSKNWAGAYMGSQFIVNVQKI